MSAAVTAIALEAALPEAAGSGGAVPATGKGGWTGAVLADELHARFEPCATPVLARPADRPAPGNS